MALKDKAMLVSLSIGEWTAKKKDKNVSNKAAQDFLSNEKWGNYIKKLIDDTAKDKITKVKGKARTYCNKVTMAWDSKGVRILPAAVYMEFAAEMRKFHAEYESVVDEMVDKIDDLIQDAQINLAGMYNPKDYPSKDKLLDKYYFDVKIFPITTSDDFRITLSNSETEIVKRSMEERFNQALADTNKELWGRLYKVVNEMVESFSEEEKIFRDTKIKNAIELCALLPKLNINDDDNLEQMRRQVEQQLCNLSPDVLRTDTRQRQQAANTAKDILSDMKTLSGNFGWGDAVMMREEEENVLV